jgi:DNA-binding transcriptional MerR regulator
VNERSYLSIGDVLTLLREEFPDVTISKIRFLESRGLLIPERTPSGYRKFYDHDVDRLRWILRQQRENFLPLKVIKGRLEGQEPSSEPKALFEVSSPGDSGPLEPVFASQPVNGSHTREEAAAHAAHASHAPAASHVPGPSLAHAQAGSHADTVSGGLSPQVAALAGSAPAGAVGRTASAPPEPRASAAGAPITQRPAPEPAGGSESPRHRSALAHAGDDVPTNGAAAQPKHEAHAAEEPARVGRTAVTGSATTAAPVNRIRAAVAASTGAAAPANRIPAAGAGPSPAALDVPPASPRVAARATTAAGDPVVAAPPAADDPHVSHPTRAASPAPASPAAGTPAGDGGHTAGTEGPTAPAMAAADASSLAGASLTAAELAQASGLDVRQIEELESYGLIESHLVAGVHCFDEDALVVAGLAAGFARFGVEARHLRMFKHAAERQASMYSQIVMPLLRQRNPDARRRARDDLVRLSELGASMQACFAKAVLHDLTRG